RSPGVRRDFFGGSYRVTLAKQTAVVCLGTLLALAAPRATAQSLADATSNKPAASASSAAADNPAPSAQTPKLASTPKILTSPSFIFPDLAHSQGPLTSTQKLELALEN